MLVRMLVSEGMLGRALREIAKRNDAALFEEYAKPVAGSNPGAYLAAYGRCIAGLADRAREKFDRTRVVRHLEIMAGIAGGKEAAAALAAGISARNPSKRALLEMLAPYAKRARAKAGAAKATRPGGRARLGGPSTARERARQTTRQPRSRRGPPD